MSDEQEVKVTETKAAVKPGWKTTEFWLSCLAFVLGAIAASGAIPESSQWVQIMGMATTVLASMGYSSSRGKAKATK